MNTRFPHTQAEAQGFISVQHSLDSADLRYFLLVPHDSSRLAFPDEVTKFFPQDEDLLRRVLEIKRDKGSRELAKYIISHVPGGIAAYVDVARGILDLNRTPEFALGSVISPDISEDAKKMLINIHQSIIQSIDELLAALPPKAKMLCLHSMETNELQKAKAECAKESMLKYISCREENVGVGPEMKVDMITGPKGEEDLADLKMKNTLAALFEKNGIPWAENEPYATERNVHKSTDYMLARPGNVLVVDFPKHFLCTGEAKDKTLSMVHAQADQAKIKKAGKILAEALEQVLA